MPSTLLRLVALLLLFFPLCFPAMAQSTCTSPQRVCEATSVPAATSGASLGPIYCVNNTENASFYFFEVATGGDITFRLSGTYNIDYVLLGSYDDINSLKSACNSLSTQPLVSCSSSTNATHDVTLTGVSGGKYYLLILINRTGNAQNVTINKVSGSATAQCCTLDATATVTPVCAVSPDLSGNIQITAYNTTGLVEYSIDNGVTWSTSNLFRNNAAGAYRVVVRDESLCYKYLNVVVPSSVENNYISPTTQTVCAGQQPATIYGSQPTGGGGVYTYLWQQSATDPYNNFNPAPGINNQPNYTPPIANQTFWYRRQVIVNGCPSNTVGVEVAVTQGNVTANAGPDQQLCAQTSADLNATPPQTGTGQWSQVSGPTTASFTNPAQYNTPVTGLSAGTYVFRWTVTTPNCGSAFDDVRIVIGAPPTTANAGPDQSLCNVTSATLAGNAPTVGTGVWTQISGANVVIQNASSPNATVTGLVAGTYEFRWTISSGSCAASSDVVRITVTLPPTPAAAGGDQPICDATTTTLSGNSPVNGTGTWSQVSGPNTATIATATSPTTGVSGLIPGTYVFRWTIANGNCTPSTDDMSVVLSPSPQSVEAGPDQDLCEAVNATMAATPAPVGIGTWAQESGPNTANIQNVNDPQTLISGLTSGIYVFSWTISSGNCRVISDRVAIRISPQASAANAGPDQTQYNSGIFSMAANTPQYGHGIWSLVSGSATIDNPTSPTTTVTVPANSTAVLRWTIISGACPPGTDDVTLVYQRQADISVEKHDLGSTYKAGENIAYQVVVRNLGPSDARLFTFTDLLPDGLENYSWTIVGAGNGVSAVPSQGTSRNIASVMTIPANQPAASISVLVSARVPAGTPRGTVYTNTATVTAAANTPDPVMGNNTASVTGAVPNNPPVAVNDHYTTPRGVAVSANVLVNDTDPDNDPLTVTTTAVTAPSHGLLALNADGSFTYTPGPAYTGTDQFAYRVCDNQGACDTALVTISVIPPSTAVRILKQATPATVVAGQNLRYTVTFTNDGPSSILPGEIVLLEDVQPAGYQIISVTSSQGTVNLTTGQWTGLTLAAGQSATITVEGTVTSAYQGASITNTIGVKVPSNTTDTLNASSSVTTPVTKACALSITKTDGATVFVPGRVTTYTIVVRNTGPSDVVGAAVSDALPAGITTASWTASVTGGATVPATSGTGAIQQAVNIPVGGVITYTYRVTVPASLTGNLVNTATVTAPQGYTENDTSDNTATDTDTAAPVYGFNLVKTAPAGAVAGESIVFTLTASNSGPSDASNVTISDVVPATIGSVTWTVATQGAATATTTGGSGNNITVTGNLPAGSANKIMITITGQIDNAATGTIRNSGSIQAPGAIPAPSNETTTTLMRQTGISVVKAGPTGGSVEAGNSIAYTVMVTNAGPSDAVNVAIADVVPSMVTNVTWGVRLNGSSTLASGAPSSGAGNNIATTANIPAGAGNSVEVLILGVVDPAAQGQIINIAQATPAGESPQQGTDTTQVKTVPGLDIHKSGPAAADAGSAIHYSITVANNGPSDAPNVSVRDLVPLTLENVSWTAAAAGTAAITGGATGTGNNLLVTGQIPAGAGNSITVQVSGTVSASASGTIHNGAFVLDHESRRTESEDVVTVINKRSQVHVQKVAPATAAAGETITYSIVMQNDGPSDAYGLELRDTLPAAFTGGQLTTDVEGGASVNAAIVSGQVLYVSANLPAGTQHKVTVTLTGRISPDFSGTLVNTAYAQPPGQSPVPSNEATTVVSRSSSLSVKKSGPASAAAGSQIAYAVRIINNGPSDAKGVVIADIVPAAVTGVTWKTVPGGLATITAGATGSGNNVSVTADIPAGAANAIVLDIYGTIDPAATGSVKNAASATAPGGTPVTSDTVITTLTSEPRLQITKAAPKQANAGNALTYTVTVDNTGLSDAINVNIVDAVPTQITGASWSATATGGAVVLTGATGTGNNLAVTSNIPAGTGRIVITIQGKTDPGFVGVISNFAQATAPGKQPVTASATTNVTEFADVVFRKTGPDTVNAGDRLTYTITLVNNGPSNVSSFEIADALPPQLTNPAWIATATGGAAITAGAIGSGYTMRITGSIPAGSANRIMVTVSGTVNPAYTGDVNNYAALNRPGQQPLMTPTVKTYVRNKADVRVFKIAPDSASAGEGIGYLIGVYNLGPSTARNVSVRDIIPSAIGDPRWAAGAFGSASVNGINSGAGNTIDVNCDLPPGTSNNVTIFADGVIAPGFTGTLENIAGIYDSTGRRIASDTARTAVGSTVSLRITKTAPDTLIAGDAITYSLDITNSGPSDAVNVTITDTIPAVIGRMLWLASKYGNATITSATAGRSNIISVTGNIPAGNPNSIRVVAVGIVDPAYTGGPIRNIAFAQAGGHVVSDTAQTVANVLPDVRITKTGPQTLYAGDSVVYHMRVVNDGPSVAGDIRITDTLAAGILQPVWSVTTAGSATTATPLSGTGNVFVTGSLPVGQANYIDITVSGVLDPQFNGNSLRNTAWTLTNGTLLDSSAVDASVLQATDLHVLKVGPTMAGAGERISYTIIVNNNGPSFANDMTIRDTVPAEVTNVVWTTGVAGGATVSAAGGTGNIIALTGDIPTGTGVITINVTGMIAASAPEGVINNTARVKPGPGVSAAQEEISTVSTSIRREADLVVVKSGPGDKAAGAPIQYDLVLTNRGPADVVGALVKDGIPPGIQNVNVTGAATGGASFVIQPTSDDTVRANVDIPAGLGNQVTLTITGTVNPALVKSILFNTATITEPAGVTELVPANNISIVNTRVTTDVGVLISKSGPATVNVHDNVRYRIEVTNSGVSDAAGVSITDQVPASLDNVTWTATALGGGANTVSPVSGTGNVAATATITGTGGGTPGTIVIDITGTVREDAPDTILNAATASFGGDRTSSVETAVNKSVDLRITKMAPAGIPAGEVITWLLRVVNLGPANAVDATIRDVVPATVENVTWTAVASGGAAVSAASGSGNDVQLNAGIPVGTGEVLVTITGRVSDRYTGVLTNTAIAVPAPGITDPFPATSTTNTTVYKSLGLSAIKFGPAQQSAGLPVNYTIRVRNSGASMADGVVITDSVSSALLNVSWTATAFNGAVISSGATGAGNLLRIVADIPSGDLVTAFLTGTANPSFSGVISNGAEAGNNDQTILADTVRTLIVNEPALKISKTGPPSLVAGTEAAYTITVSNRGPSAARDVRIEDLLPAQTQSMHWSAVANGDAEIIGGPVDNVQGTVGLMANIPPGDTNNIVVNVFIMTSPGATGSVKNVATASAGNSEVKDSVISNIALQPGLRIVKTAPSHVAAGQSVSYAIFVNNDGPSVAANTIISDVLPAGLIDPTWSATAAGAAAIQGGNIPSRSGNVSLTADIPPGRANFIRITVTGGTDPATTNVLTNKATAIADGGSSVESNTVTTAVVKENQVLLLKSGPAAANSGEQIHYRMEVRNNGPSMAMDVRVTDVLPVQLRTVRWSATAFGAAVISGGNIVDSTGNVGFTTSMPAGHDDYVAVDISGTIDPAFEGTLRNVGAFQQPDSLPVNGSEVVTVVTARPGIRLSKSAPDSLAAGGTITYHLQVNNDGPSDSKVLHIRDTLDASLASVSWAAVAQGAAVIRSGANGSGAIVDVSAEIPAGPGNGILVTITGKTKANAAGQLLNAGWVLQSDSVMARDEAVTALIRQTDLFVTKSGPAAVFAGGAVQYVIEAWNTGVSDEPQAVVQDIVPQQVKQTVWAAEFIGDAQAAGATAGQGNSISVPAVLPAGAANRVRITVNGVVDPAFAGSLTNVAKVLSGAAVRDSSIATTNVQADALIQLTKSGPARANAGTSITYVLRAANQGVSDLTGISIIDTVPVTLTNVRWTTRLEGKGSITSGATGTGNVVSVGGRLNGGANAIVVEITGQVPATATGTLLNTASSQTAGGPLVRSNTVRTDIVPVVAIQLNKSALINASAARTLTYTVAVRNNGPSPATGVQIRDTISSPLSNVSWKVTAFGNATATPSTGAGPLVAFTANLPAGSADRLLLEVTSTVPDGFVGTIRNRAYAMFNGTNYPSNEVATNVSRSADLSINKSGPANAALNGRVTYILNVRNGGPGNADGAVMTDVVPTGLMNITASSGLQRGGAADVNIVVAGNTVTATFGKFSAGALVPIVITATAVRTGIIRNMATVTPPTGINDPIMGNNRSEEVVTEIVPKVKLNITKQVITPPPFRPGQTVRYRIEVSQPGKFPLSAVMMNDQLPATLRNIVVSQPSQGTASFNDATRMLNWRIGLLGAGVTASLEYDATLPASGDVVNVAIAFIPGTGEEPAVADTATASLKVGLEADLRIAKQLQTQPPYRIGDYVQYLVTLTNAGPYPATGVRVTDELPANLHVPEGIHTSAGSTQLSGRTLNWLLDSLAVGASATLQFSIRINEGGVLVNGVTATGAEIDPDLSNNSARTQESPITGDDVFIPNIITPNGDGRNDKFVVLPVGKYPGTSLTIYNRWGNQVYQSKDYHNEWDGGGLNESTYYYILVVPLPDGPRTYKGWVQLAR
ncbi:PKD domain-containing protein [Chitinophaga lutea]